jgi:hypothetical protein
MRQVSNGLEFLLKRPSAAFCTWAHEDSLMQDASFADHLHRFQDQPSDFGTLAYHGSIHAIARRLSTCEYLFRVEMDNCVVFYWDAPTDPLEARAASDYDYCYTDVECRVPDVPTEVPTVCCDDLHPFQTDDVNWIIGVWRKALSGCILGDEFGMGKTVQALRFLVHLQRHSDWRGPFLILTSNQKDLSNWLNEVQSNGKVAALIYDGSPDVCCIIREWGFSEPLHFELLMTTYATFARDFDFLKDIKFQVLCCDNPTFLNDHHGSAFLKKWPVPFTIALLDSAYDVDVELVKEVIAFVRPAIGSNWLNSDLDDVILCRKASSLNGNFEYKQEFVGFLSPTAIQLMLLKMARMQQLDRFFKGQAWLPIEVLIRKICNHPCLLEGLEGLLIDQLRSDDKVKIIGLSSKFICLDRCLATLQKQHRRPIIMTQQPNLLELLEEFCKINLWAFATLSDQTEEERRDLIQFIKSEEGPLIVFSTISLRSEEVLPGTTVFILDADWHPDMQIVHPIPIFRRSSDEEPILFIRLLLFGGDEHLDYVQHQRQQFLWQKKLFGLPATTETLHPPPDLALVSNEPSDDFRTTLIEMAQLVPITAFDSIAQSSNFDAFDSFSDQDWVSSVSRVYFSVEESQGSRESSRTVDEAMIVRLIGLLKQFGFGSWSILCKQFSSFAEAKIIQLACIITIFAFRSLPPTFVSTCPVLVYKLRKKVPQFSLSILLCSDARQVHCFFSDSHEFHEDIRLLKRFVGTIVKSAETFLLILEMKLVYGIWLKDFGTGNLLLKNMPPPRDSQGNLHCFRVFRDFREPDIEDCRLSEVLELMLFDVINEIRPEKYAKDFDWWGESEFLNVFCVIKSFGLDNLSEIGFHAKTGLLSKTTVEVSRFVRRLKSMAATGPGSFAQYTRLQAAPEEIRIIPRVTNWANLEEDAIAEIEFVARVFGLIAKVFQKADKMVFELPNDWTAADMVRLVIGLRDAGLHKFDELFEDKILTLPPRRVAGREIIFLSNLMEFADYLSRMCDEED